VQDADADADADGRLLILYGKRTQLNHSCVITWARGRCQLARMTGNGVCGIVLVLLYCVVLLLYHWP
jgi:hypothetical protein